MFQLLYQHLLKGPEIFDILQFVPCNSVITVRTIKCTQVFWSHSVTTYQLVHAENIKQLFCTIVCSLMMGQWVPKHLAAGVL